MPARIEIDQRDVLLVVDMQNDFLPGGALAVTMAMRSSRSSIVWPSALPMSC